MHQETVTLQRDCAAIQIPSGSPITLAKGTPAMIMQSLGGAYTLMANGMMVRIERENADAIGKAPTAPPSSTAPSTQHAAVDEQAVYQQLKQVFDPEIPVNIVDLGLVYETLVEAMGEGKWRVNVKMTLTAPGCGMGPAIAADARARILELPGVGEAAVDLVWDPPWHQGMISETGRMQLGWV